MRIASDRSRLLISSCWMSVGVIFGALIGLGLFTAPNGVWRSIMPWLGIAMTVGWASQLIAARRDDQGIRWWTVALAVGVWIFGVFAAIRLADWWLRSMPRRHYPDLSILLLWFLCGAVGGYIGGLPVGLVQARVLPLARRLATASLLAFLWSIVLGATGVLFLALAYPAMSLVYRVPLPLAQNPAAGWIVTGAFLGLLVGVFGVWIHAIGRATLGLPTSNE